MKNVYFNHDGNIDDLTSLLLLLQVPDIRLVGVGVTDADCFVEPAAEASRKASVPERMAVKFIRI